MYIDSTKDIFKNQLSKISAGFLHYIIIIYSFCARELRQGGSGENG